MVDITAFLCVIIFTSHHQKYLLRKTPEVFTYLKFTNEELVTSPVATRLNGYCGIYGKLSDLEKEIDLFGLDKQLQFELRRVVRRAILPLEPSAC